jgi:hypothetical protein
MLHGWIMLHRKILDNWVSQEPEMLAVWIRILLEANHADTKRMFNGCHIEIKRGQLIFGLNAFSLKSGVSENKVRRYINLLEKDGMINRLKTNKYSLISIVNFDSYQGSDSQTTGETHSNDSQTTSKPQHRNNDNNGNNDKNKDSVPLQQILDAYHEHLPAMAEVQIYTDKRKSKARTFFNKRKAEYKKKGVEYNIEMVVGYFKYIAENCSWMLETRPNGKGGFWKAKNFDFVITEDCYVAVKEQRFDNMES